MPIITIPPNTTQSSMLSCSYILDAVVRMCDRLNLQISNDYTAAEIVELIKNATGLSGGSVTVIGASSNCNFIVEYIRRDVPDSGIADEIQKYGAAVTNALNDNVILVYRRPDTNSLVKETLTPIAILAVDKLRKDNELVSRVLSTQIPMMY